MLFDDRHDAGRRLGRRLKAFADANPVVLGLPRGGVPVAFDVAAALHAPLDVIVVHKLGVPYQPELAMGAIGEDGVRLLDEAMICDLRLSDDDVAAVEKRERAAMDERSRSLRGHTPPVRLTGRTVLVVDDGLATGSTARAACRIARARGATRVVLAVPVAPRGAAAHMLRDADEVICLVEPDDFRAVGQFYRDFEQVSDAEVVALLTRAGAQPAPGAGASAAGRDSPPPAQSEVVLDAGRVRLPGTLAVPDAARAVILFAHGSGSSRRSPRNRFVADALHDAGFATLLFDLLTADEERDRRHVFDVELLAGRLLAAAAWVRAEPSTDRLPVGYFGASTGAAAALAAAGRRPAGVFAVVSRGGRPDLAADDLPRVHAPTLLVVGGRDEVVLDLNRQALDAMQCPRRLEIVPGATHLFEEPGALEAVARLAADWFRQQLPADAAAAGAAVTRPA